MTKITINSKDYELIINVDSNQNKTPFIPKFLNQTSVTIEEYLWNLKPLKLRYVLRLNSEEKWILDQVLLNAEKVNFKDEIYGLDNDVWIGSVDCSWVGYENFDKPFRYVITIDKVFDNEEEPEE